jgi:leucyl-tRNA synthetase
VEAAAREDDAVKQHLAGLTVRKVIVVPGRIVNIVAS